MCNLSVLLALTDAVGLQRAELESRLALAGVAGLHRNTFATATYGGGEGTLVDTCEKPHRVIAQEVSYNNSDIWLTDFTDTLSLRTRIPLTHVALHGTISCCFISGILDGRTGFTVQ